MTDDQSAAAAWLYANGMRKLSLRPSRLFVATASYEGHIQPHSLMLSCWFPQFRGQKVEGDYDWVTWSWGKSKVSHVTIRYHTRLPGNRDRGLFLATRDLTSHSLIHPPIQSSSFTCHHNLLLLLLGPCFINWTLNFFRSPALILLSPFLIQLLKMVSTSFDRRPLRRSAMCSVDGNSNYSY